MKGKLFLLFTGLAVIFFSSSAPAQKPYRGAEYRTIGTMTYGRFEVRMRSAPVSGMLSSFFTYYDAASPWNEIDIETMGRYSNEIQFNTIVPANGNNHVQRQTVPFNPHAAFHVLGFEWTPDYVAWRIDGEEVYRQTGTHISQLVKPQKIMMNVWQPADVSWAGSFSAAQLPVYA
ncbi:MAG: family 16 glycosylhydrolase, partial [Bacteroidota bacterium]